MQMSNIIGSPVEVYHQYNNKTVQGKSPSSSRRKREFVPNEMKDASYWEKRKQNNLAAKKSREKRRLHDFKIEKRILALNLENSSLKAELLLLKAQFGLVNPPTHIQHVHTNHNNMENNLPEGQVLKRELPFLSLPSINWGVHTFSQVEVVSTGSIMGELETHPVKYDVNSDKEQISSFQKCSFLARPTHSVPSNHHTMNTSPLDCSSFYNFQISASAPDLLSQYENLNRLSQELPKVNCFSGQDHLHYPEKVPALPHKLRIKGKGLLGVEN